MKLYFRYGVWAVVSSFAEKDVVKSAGFWWHAMPCNKTGCLACVAGLQKSWYTTKVEVAARLRNASANDETRAQFASLDAKVDESRATDSAVTIEAPPDMAYKGYQKAGIVYTSQRKATLIADEMGLGKTIQGLGLINHKPVENVLVICPKSVKLNWENEAKLWLVQPREFFQVTDLESARRATETCDGPRLVIVNFDRVRDPDIFKELFWLKWDLLIVDEAQRLKNHESQQTVAVLGREARPKKNIEAKEGLRHRAECLLLLTGTPILNKPAEFQTLLAACDDQFKGFGFLRRYCNAHQENKFGREVWNFDGSSNEDELQAKARASCMIRRLKKDVLTELAPKVRQVVILEPDARQQRLIRKENQAATDTGYESQVADLEHFASKLYITELAELRHELGLAKVDAAVEHIQLQLESTPKAIVFCHHKDVAQALAEGLGTELVITGDTKEQDRMNAVDRFQKSDESRVIVGTIGAMGVGLTLTASQYVAIVELSHVPADVSQAEDRAHRIGQKGSVLIQHLVFNGSLDCRIAKRLLAKQAVIDKVLDIPAVPVEIPPEVEAAGRVDYYPEIAAEQKQLALDAMRFLAARCDGAQSKDGQGFSKTDVDFGKSLAAKNELTNGQAFYALKLVRKYHGQLAHLTGNDELFKP